MLNLFLAVEKVVLIDAQLGTMCDCIMSMHAGIANCSGSYSVSSKNSPARTRMPTTSRDASASWRGRCRP